VCWSFVRNVIHVGGNVYERKYVYSMGFTAVICMTDQKHQAGTFCVEFHSRSRNMGSIVMISEDLRVHCDCHWADFHESHAWSTA
jgi:hypothetical protein